MNELIVLDNINPLEVFNGNGLNELLEKIDKEAHSLVPDLNTDKGRKSIASMASKVARSKTYLDGLGKDLVSDWKTKAKAVDGERKKMRDHLDALKEDVRKPLTEWEDMEKERLGKHESEIAEISESGSYISEHWLDLPIETMKDRLIQIEATEKDWEEYLDRASEVKEAAISRISKAIEKREAHEAEQAELEKLRKEAAIREQKEREERIAKEAAEEATRKAEEVAKALEVSIELERQAAEKAKEKELEHAEIARQSAIRAKEKAERDAIEAAQKERERIEQQHKDEEAAAKKREANKKHNAKINNAALKAFKKAGMPEEYAKLAVTEIAKGNIPNIRISY